jgi:hypothetical protein
MFRRFLDATDYWFSYSEDSSVGSYDPAREFYVVIADDPANATGARAPATGSFLMPWGLGRAWPQGRAPLLPHHR